MKINEIYKKYKKVIVGIGLTIGSIFTYLLFNSRGERKFYKDIDKNQERLRSSIRKQSESIERSEVITSGLEEQGDRLSSLETITNELEAKEHRVKGRVGTIDEKLKRDQEDIRRLGDSIQELDDFIQQNSNPE